MEFLQQEQAMLLRAREILGVDADTAPQRIKYAYYRLMIQYHPDKNPGNPLSLAGALEKLDGYSKRIPMRAGSEATAHMFIVNPFSTSKVAGWFSTHPPMADRVQRLRSMAGGGR